LKYLFFLSLLVASFAATWIFQTFRTTLLRPVLTSLHIPAPQFTFSEMISAAARKHGVNAAFIKSIIAAESAFSPTAISPKGAVGLMQLMPETAREFGADPAVPEQNIDAGAHYLSWLMQRYSHHKDQLRRVIAAYNAGPGAVEHYRGVPPYRETRVYVARVLRLFKRYRNEA